MVQDSGLVRRTTCAITAILAMHACAPEMASSPDDEPSDGKDDLWNPNQRVLLPFPAGADVRITQTFHGELSHKGKEAYAVDFLADVGTPIAAARAGMVIATRSDSTRGCPDKSCLEDANYIIVDHGDGTLARYYHLAKDGVDVKVGQTVCRGAVIGRTGNTGFSTGPHLHFDIMNLYGDTVPVLFEEIADAQQASLPRSLGGKRLHGVPYPGAVLASNNDPTQCRTVQPSRCDDIFIHFGVRITSETSCKSVRFDQEYPFEGIVYGDYNRVLIHWTNAGEWKQACVKVDRVDDTHGTFKTTLVWPKAGHRGDTFLMVQGARASGTGCDYAWGTEEAIELIVTD